MKRCRRGTYRRAGGAESPEGAARHAAGPRSQRRAARSREKQIRVGVVDHAQMSRLQMLEGTGHRHGLCGDAGPPLQPVANTLRPRSVSLTAARITRSLVLRPHETVAGTIAEVELASAVGSRSSPAEARASAANRVAARSRRGRRGGRRPRHAPLDAVVERDRSVGPRRTCRGRLM